MVKDNIASKDNMETTAGSWALLGSIVPRDAFVVKRLREAGAVLFGKTTLSEWADMRSNSYSEGYSARGGQCRSAYNLTKNPGGSSSGSAVSVSINAIAFALGTETDGSGKLSRKSTQKMVYTNRQQSSALRSALVLSDSSRLWA
jgi:amidase